MINEKNVTLCRRGYVGSRFSTTDLLLMKTIKRRTERKTSGDLSKTQDNASELIVERIVEAKA